MIKNAFFFLITAFGNSVQSIGVSSTGPDDLFDTVISLGQFSDHLFCPT